MKLKDTPLGAPEEFNVVVEIPKGSEKKFEYDEEKDEIILDFVFQGGFHFIFNYGFIPQTKADDGDTLDAILLGETPIPSGTVVVSRPIGVMRMLDRGKGDDKIIAVPIGNAETEKYQSIKDVSQDQVKEFIAFYAEVARQKQKTIEITGFEDKIQAIQAIKKAVI